MSPNYTSWESIDPYCYALQLWECITVYCCEEFFFSPFIWGFFVSCLGANNILHILFNSNYNWFIFLQWYSFCSLIIVHFDYRFDIFKPMHEMWKDYIMPLLKSCGYFFCIFAVDEFHSFLSSSCPAKRMKR